MEGRTSLTSGSGALPRASASLRTALKAAVLSPALALSVQSLRRAVSEGGVCARAGESVPQSSPEDNPIKKSAFERDCFDTLKLHKSGRDMVHHALPLKQTQERDYRE